MFEQSSYNIEPAAEPAKPGDLFHNYELRNWDYGPRLYKIAAIAGVANLLALLIFAQTSVLTMKGCDSPLVSGVCQALDIVDIGQAMLFGTPRNYVDTAYNKTDLGDYDITYVDVSNVDAKLEYPGSFRDATTGEDVPFLGGQSVATMDNPFDPNSPNYIPPSTVAPGIPITTPNTGGSLIDTTPVKPKKNNKPIDGELPDSIGDDTAGNKNGKGKGGTGDKGNSNGDTTAQTDPAQQPNVDPSSINRRPFADYADKVNDLLDKKEVTLDAPFIVKARGKLNKDGKIDVGSWKWIQQTAAPQDKKIIDVVKDGMSAINDSGLLTYLSNLSGETCDLQVQQDGTNFTLSVQSVVKDEYRANSLKSGLGILLAAAKSGKDDPNADQNQKDDFLLLNSAAVRTDGKKLILEFTIPKEAALQMINRKLAEQKAAAGKPNGNLMGKTGTNAGD